MRKKELLERIELLEKRVAMLESRPQWSHTGQPWWGVVPPINPTYIGTPFPPATGGTSGIIDGPHRTTNTAGNA